MGLSPFKFTPLRGVHKWGDSDGEPVRSIGNMKIQKWVRRPSSLTLCFLIISKSDPAFRWQWFWIHDLSDCIEYNFELTVIFALKQL